MKSATVLLLGIIIMLIPCGSALAFPNDSTSVSSDLKFKPSALIIPTALITFGVHNFKNPVVRDLNGEIQEELMENIDRKITADDFTQYVPMVAVYGLNACGIKGKNDFANRTLILATAYAIMGTTVTTMKYSIDVERPDGSGNNSFPSGHTATAFMAAEFLFQEYRDVSVWYGISGYALAAATGYFRMHNNRHWLTDVAAGAGIGILSTKIAYWVNPFLREKVFKGKKTSQTAILPYYNGEQFGLALSFKF
ncbi:MAG: phosphatase PAP2 family protein [Mangrovibacterium sp.]